MAHTTGRRLRSRNRLIGTAIAGCTVLLLSACGSDAEPDARPSRTSSPSTSSSSPTANPDEAAALKAYHRSWEEQAAAYAKASSAGTALKKVTTLQALADVERDLAAMREAGQVTTGKPEVHPQTPELTEGKIPKATIADCVDTTHWTLIDKGTKKAVPLPSTRLTKYVSTATLEKWGTKWMVTKLTAQDQKC